MIDGDVLDVSEALDDLERPVTIKTVTVTTVDFVKDEVVTARPQDCVIQVASPQSLKAMDVDLSFRHIRVHSKSDINLKELIEFNGADYRVITPSEWDGYGYAEVIAQETKQDLRVPTP